PSIPIARCCTICAAHHFPGGALYQSASGRPASGPKTRSGMRSKRITAAPRPRAAAPAPPPASPAAADRRAHRPSRRRRGPPPPARRHRCAPTAPIGGAPQSRSGAPSTGRRHPAERKPATTYTMLAPLSNVLDALTFLSLARARAFLAVWVIALGAWGALRRGSLGRRLGRAVIGPLAIVLLGVGAVLLPRPVPALVTSDSSVTVLDYHAHTAASHDGQPGWQLADLAAWHAAQGFEASYVTDHNVVFNQTIDEPIRLLPGVEWSVFGQHIVAIGAVAPIDRSVYNRDTRSMLRLFAALHRQG